MTKLDPEQIGLLLNDTWRAWRAKLDSRLKPLGLSQGKWRTLVHLSKGGDQMSQSELAARMSIEQEMGYSGLGGTRAKTRCSVGTNTYTFAAVFCYTPHPLYNGDFRDRPQPSRSPR